jgi:hypothetical protein
MFDSVPFDDAVYTALYFMQFYNDTTGNDGLAIQLFSDVLAFSADTLQEEIAALQTMAFQNMKTTVEHCFLTDSISSEDNSSAFHPLVQSYVDVLMDRTADVVDESNYVEQFYLEIDKAQLFNLIGRREMCWQLLNNLDNCPVDSTEQAYLNSWIYSVEKEILDLQAGIGAYISDSIYSEVDTSYFNTPFAIEADEFYFGSNILSVDLVTYANCDLVTWKNLSGLEEDLQFLIYPNPTQSILTLAYESKPSGTCIFSIQDMNGRKLIEQAILNEKGIMQFDLSQYPDGVYVYQIMDGKEVLQSGQIVKQR